MGCGCISNNTKQHSNKVGVIQETIPTKLINLHIISKTINQIINQPSNPLSDTVYLIPRSDILPHVQEQINKPKLKQDTQLEKQVQQIQLSGKIQIDVSLESSNQNSFYKLRTNTNFLINQQIEEKKKNLDLSIRESQNASDRRIDQTKLKWKINENLKSSKKYARQSWKQLRGNSLNQLKGLKNTQKKLKNQDREVSVKLISKIKDQFQDSKISIDVSSEKKIQILKLGKNQLEFNNQKRLPKKDKIIHKQNPQIKRSENEIIKRKKINKNVYNQRNNDEEQQSVYKNSSIKQLNRQKQYEDSQVQYSKCKKINIQQMNWKITNKNSRTYRINAVQKQSPKNDMSEVQIFNMNDLQISKTINLNRNSYINRYKDKKKQQSQTRMKLKQLHRVGDNMQDNNRGLDGEKLHLKKTQIKQTQSYLVDQQPQSPVYVEV